MKTLALVFAVSGICLAADQAPNWLREVSTETIPNYPAKTPAVVLVQEESVTLEPNGKQIQTTRFAVKVLNREGAREARFSDYYNSDTGKPRDIKGWLISASGKTKEYGKGETTEVGGINGLYDQGRVRSLSVAREADPGAIFGAESTIERTTVFSQFSYDFQDDLPALRSSFSLTLPTGWRAEAKVIRGSTSESMTPEMSGSTYRWQLKKLDPWDPEPNSPLRSALRPRLVVSTFPPSGSNATTAHFQTWRDVSIWTSQLVAKSAEVTPDIQEAAKRVSGSGGEQIRSLSANAQKIRYVSVQINTSRGGGYTPHPASFVLSKGYGDCKDKANYLLTMLKASGVDAYLVAIFSGDPHYTRPEWPSPHQFNHMILAIRVPDDTKAPAAFDFPGIGRLLLFDPTDESVPFGSIPDHEQSSHALLVAGEKGDLFKTPSTPPSSNRVSRKTKFSVDENGALKAQIAESAVGQPAFDARAAVQQRSLPEFVKRQERYLARMVPGVSIQKVEPTDKAASFEMSAEFTSDHYAKMMQGRLMMIRPLPLPADGLPDVSNSKRLQPLVLSASSFEEEAELNLPSGFEIDELPRYGDVTTEFGKYSMKVVPEGGKVLIKRSLEIQSALVQPQDYPKVRDFIARVGGSERTPIVLMKK